MDNTTFAALAHVARPFGPVTLPGGTVVHVRQLTLGELRKIDAEAETAAEGERGISYAVLVAAYALCDADGTAVIIKPYLNADLAALEEMFTAGQLRVIGEAAVGVREDAKKS